MMKNVFGFKRALVMAGIVCSSVISNAQDANYVWAKSIGGTGSDGAAQVAVDANGNVYVTGSFGNTGADFNPGGSGGALTSAGNSDAYVAKYSPTGTFLWVKSMGGTGADGTTGIAVDANGNVYVTGSFGNTGADFNPGGSGGIVTSAGKNDGFLAKYDTAGNFLWAKKYGGTGNDYCKGVAADANGNVYVIGSIDFVGADFNPGGSGGALTSAGKGDVFVVKYSPTGSFLWAKSMGGTGDDVVSKVAVDANGNVYIVGYFDEAGADFNPGGSGGALTSAGSSDVFVAKYSSTGTFLWAKSMGGTESDLGLGVATDNNGNVYVTGSFGITGADFNPGGSGGVLTPTGGIGIRRNFDAYVAKYSSTGTFLWAKGMGGTLYDESYGVATDANGNVYVTGWFDSATPDFNPGGSGGTLTTAGGYDAFVAKYSPSGTFLWAKSMGGTGAESGVGVVVDTKRNVYVTGYFGNTEANFNPGGSGGVFISAGGRDGFLVKFNQECTIYTSFRESECDSFTFNGQNYTASGTYADTFTSSANCDSIVTLYLTITGQTSNNPVVSGHYCDSVTFNGETYTSSGTYIQYYANAGGCDSNINYDLTIGQSNGSTRIDVACDSFVFNEVAYTTTDTYFVIFNNVTGCDSTVVLDLTIKRSPVASVIKSGLTLTANSSESYRWFNCDDNNIIDGATEQSYTATQTGNYAVIITTNDCSDTSGCILVEAPNNINGLGTGNRVQLYPNPTDSRINIQAERTLKNVTIRLMNIVGQVLVQTDGLSGASFTLDMAQYTAGVYFVEINEQGKIIRLKAVKK